MRGGDGRDPMEDFIRSFFNEEFFREPGGPRGGGFFFGPPKGFFENSFFREESPSRQGGFFRDSFFSRPSIDNDRPPSIFNGNQSDRYYEPPSEREHSTLWARMANKSREALNGIFGRFDNEPSEPRRPAYSYRNPNSNDIRTPGSGRLFFDDERENHLVQRGNDPGYINPNDPLFLRFPEGAKKELPRTMYTSVSVSTRRGPDGERITTTTVNDQNGSHTTVTREDGSVIEGDPNILPPSPFGGDSMPSDFGPAFGLIDIFSKFFGEEGFPMGGQNGGHIGNIPRQQHRNPSNSGSDFDSSPPPNIFSDEYCSKQNYRPKN